MDGGLFKGWERRGLNDDHDQELTNTNSTDKEEAETMQHAHWNSQEDQDTQLGVTVIRAEMKQT